MAEDHTKLGILGLLTGAIVRSVGCFCFERVDLVEREP